MSTELATAAPQGGELAVQYNYGEASGQGFENISQSDLGTPFLAILQANSPQVAGAPDKRVRGATAGSLFNTLTKELYDPTVGVVIQPCETSHVFVEWRPRTAGGGIVNVHEQNSEIVAKAREVAVAEKRKFGKGYLTRVDEKGNVNDLVETIYLVGLLHQLEDLDAQAKLGKGLPIILTFQSTRIKPYRNMFSRLYTFTINGNRPPLFAHRLRVKTVYEKNTAGQDYYNFNLTSSINDNVTESLIPVGGEASKLLRAGMELRQQFAAGISRINHEKSTGDTEGQSNAPSGDDIPF